MFDREKELAKRLTISNVFVGVLATLLIGTWIFTFFSQVNYSRTKQELWILKNAIPIPPPLEEHLKVVESAIKANPRAMAPFVQRAIDLVLPYSPITAIQMEKYASDELSQEIAKWKKNTNLARLTELESQSQILQNTVALLEKEKQGAQQKIITLEGKLNSASGLYASNEGLKKDLASAGQKEASLRDEISRLKMQLDRVSPELKEILSSEEVLNIKKRFLRQRINEVDADIEALTRRIAAKVPVLADNSQSWTVFVEIINAKGQQEAEFSLPAHFVQTFALPKGNYQAFYYKKPDSHPYAKHIFEVGSYRPVFYMVGGKMNSFHCLLRVPDGQDVE